MGFPPGASAGGQVARTGAARAWTIYHSDRLLRLPRVLAEHLITDPLAIVIHRLPPGAKMGDDEAAALIIARSPLLAQLKNLCNIVWYNMDDTHREALLRRLACLPAIGSRRATELAVEARRTPSRVRFDFNETRTHADDRVQRDIEAAARRFTHPQLVRAAHSLIASRHGVPMEAVQLFRGANEAIKASVTSVVKPGWRVLLPDVTYIGHVKAAIAARSRIAYLPISSGLLADLTARQVTAPRLIEVMYRVKPHALLLGNPSNPLGDFLDRREFQQLFEATAALQPAPILIIDTAFDKFARIAGADVPDYSQYLDSGRIIIIESLSKADGYAGSRSGYIYGSPTLVGQIARLRWGRMQTSPLGAATILVSRDPDNEAAITETVRSLLGEVRWFLKEASHWLPHGSSTPPRVRRSFSGFVIIELQAMLRDQVAEHLKSVSNIDVAHVPRFFETYEGAVRGLYSDICGSPLANLLRISLGTRAENEELGAAVRSAMHL
jgi:histidinol-phosphate/aromatic aminotransferase/cobyric acid decarboxylase-like protein